MNLYKQKNTNKLCYHHHPEQGLLNDPNGLIQWKGIYHVFYQWNPVNTLHENKCWGHATSEDLIHWDRQPIALKPEDWFDKNGCYSGSSIIFKETMYLFYTGNVLDQAGNRMSYQCLATSTDGITFKKHGPVIKEIPGYTAHVRDPKVWLDTDGSWKMILGAQNDELKGRALLFSSINLWDWEFSGELVTKLSDFGYMWECPDMIIGKEKDLFIFSPQGLAAQGSKYQNLHQTGYLLGKFYNSENQFESDIPFQELDRGFEFYAPQSFVDENKRTILYGWMGIMEEQVEKQLPSVKDGWAHLLSLPRELTIKGEQVYQVPVEELKKLRGKADVLNVTKDFLYSFDQFENELLMEIDPDGHDFQIKIYNDVNLSWSSDTKLLTVSRTNWVSKKREKRTVELSESLKKLQIFLEVSTLEIFVNDGLEVFSLRLYPEKVSAALEILTGATSISTLTHYPLTIPN